MAARIRMGSSRMTGTKFEVRCTPIGTPGGKWNGHYSIYLAPAGVDDEAIVEGVSDLYDNAGDAQREGLRDAEDRAATMDAGESLIGSDESIDGLPCRVLVRYNSHRSFYIDRIQPHGMAPLMHPNLHEFATYGEALDRAKEYARSEFEGD